MTREELNVIIAGEDRPVEPPYPESDDAEMYRDIADWERGRVDALASALRSAWAEIDRLMSEQSSFVKVLDAALNSGDGTYKP